jgi:chaperonin GroEL
VLKICAVKAPGFGDRRKAMLGDIAVLTGGTFFAEDLGRSLESIEISELGRAKKIVITKDDTTIIEGAGKKAEINARADQIKSQHEKSTSDYDKREAHGAPRQAHRRRGHHPRRRRHRDRHEGHQGPRRRRPPRHPRRRQGGLRPRRRRRPAPHPGARSTAPRRRPRATRSSASTSSSHAVEKLRWQIAVNAGFDGDLVVEKIKEGKGGFGFNAGTGEYTDLVKDGHHRPRLVAKTALINAASVAGLMLTTDVLITELKEDTAVEDSAV